MRTRLSRIAIGRPAAAKKACCANSNFQQHACTPLNVHTHVVPSLLQASRPHHTKIGLRIVQKPSPTDLPSLVDHATSLFVRVASSSSLGKSCCGNDHDNSKGNWTTTVACKTLFSAPIFWPHISQPNRFEKRPHIAVSRVAVHTWIRH